MTVQTNKKGRFTRVLPYGNYVATTGVTQFYPKSGPGFTVEAIDSNRSSTNFEVTPASETVTLLFLR